MKNAVIHWNRFASGWDLIGSPLRPCAEDLAYLQQVVANWAGTRRAGTTRALLLGVTPDIAGMPWPAAVELVACDESEEMIRALWPGDVAGQRHVQRADWLRLPLADGSMDIVLGDGSFSCVDMEFPLGHQLLARAVSRVVRNDGILVARIYERPETCEQPREVFEELVAGRFDTFDVFRLKLLMAMQGDAPCITLGDVYQAWAEAAVDFDAVAARCGWRREVVGSLLRYEGSKARYSFPTLRQVRGVLSEWFEEVSISYPGYQLGDRCPTLVWRPVLKSKNG